jgi:hypothetical protein
MTYLSIVQQWQCGFFSVAARGSPSPRRWFARPQIKAINYDLWRAAQRLPKSLRFRFHDIIRMQILMQKRRPYVSPMVHK